MLSNTLAHAYGALIEAVGVSRIRFHDLRNRKATLQLSRGIHPEIVQERLVYSDIAMTLNRYSHVTADMQQEAVAALEEALSQPLAA